MKKKAAVKTPSKVGVVMKEFAKGKLRSGSDKGPKVTDPKQALAIGYSEARKEAGRAAKGGRRRKKA